MTTRREASLSSIIPSVIVREPTVAFMSSATHSFSTEKMVPMNTAFPGPGIPIGDQPEPALQ
jgi:hypothetical protein